MNTYFTDIIIILHQNTCSLPDLPALVQQCLCSIIFNNRFKSLKHASSKMKRVDFELIILGQQLFLAGQHSEHLQVRKNSNKAQTQHQQIKICIFAVSHLSWSFHRYQLEITSAHTRTLLSVLAVLTKGRRQLAGWPWQVLRQQHAHRVFGSWGWHFVKPKITASLVRGESLSQLKLALLSEMDFIVLRRQRGTRLK